MRARLVTRTAPLLVACALVCACSAPAAPPVPAAPAPRTPAAVLPAPPGPTPPASDPITRFVERCVSSGGLWVNGIDPPRIDLPATTSIEAVVAAVYERRRYARLYDSRVTSYRIADQRAVDLDADGAADDGTALWVETNLGPRILLLNAGPDGWYNRELSLD